MMNFSFLFGFLHCVIEVGGKETEILESGNLHLMSAFPFTCFGTLGKAFNLQNCEKWE